jgi:hypothetical protein
VTHLGKRSRRRRHLHLVGEAEQPPAPSRDDLLRAELRDLREEMEVMSGEALPRPDTAQKRPWWQTQGALAVAVLLMFVAAAVIGKACKWLGH